MRRVRRGEFKLLLEQLKDSSKTFQGGRPWDVICLQEPGLLKVQEVLPHSLVISTREWGSAMIIHSDLVDAECIDEMHSDKNWVAVRFKPKSPEHKPLVLISAHLPPTKANIEEEDAVYQEDIDSIRSFLKAQSRQHGQIEVAGMLDANAELPNIGDAVWSITGSVCRNDRSSSSKALILLDFLAEYNLIARNTFPNEHVSEFANGWTFTDSRKRHHLIDFVCAQSAGWYHLDFCRDLATDHCLLWTRLDTAVHRASSASKRRCRRARGKNVKGWKPSSPQQSLQFVESMNHIAKHAQNINDIAQGLQHSVNFVYHTTKADRKRVEPPPRSAEHLLAIAELMVATEPGEKRRAAAAIHKCRRKAADLAAKIKMDKQSTAGDRKHKHIAHHFMHDGILHTGASTSTPAIDAYFSKLYNPRQETEASYRSWVADVFRELESLFAGEAELCLPFDYLLDSVLSIDGDKALGADDIPPNALKLLSWECLSVVHRFFQARLNNKAAGKVHDAWHLIKVWCIEKICSTRSLSQWRPISLLSTLQKLYSSCLSQILEDQVDMPADYVLGFTEGMQTLDVTFAVRMGFEVARVWGLPIYMLRFDIHKAFDSICHRALVKSLRRLEIPARIIHAVLRELCDCFMDISVGRHRGSHPQKLFHGAKQGGRDTPRIWKVHLWGALKDLILSWEQRDLVWTAGDVSLNIKLWADDGVLFARTKRALEQKYSELVTALHEASLRVKDDPGPPPSLCWISSEHVHDLQEFCVPEGSPPVPRVSNLVLLGSCISEDGSVDVALDHRIQCATKHWFDRKAQLCRRRVPYRARVNRWFATVGKSLLFGIGEVSLRIEHLSRLNAFCLRCLRQMLGRRRDPEKETPWGFNSRLNARIRKFLMEWGIALPGATALQLHHSWAGHVVRSDRAGARLLRFRDSEWWSQESSKPASQRILRASAGRPWTWEARLVDCHGPRWKNGCSDRGLWRQLGRAFIKEQHWKFDLPQTHSDAEGVRGHDYFSKYVTHIHTSHSCLPVGSFPRCVGLRLLVVGDSDITLKAAKGRAKTDRPNLRKLWSKIQRVHFMLTNHLQVTCDEHEEGFVWVPREQNPHADALATRALMEASTEEETDFSVPWSPGDYVVIYFDGGSREIDEQTRGGAGYLVCLASGSNAEFKVLSRGSVFLGSCTNNEAEATALWLALKSAMSYMYSRV